MKHHEKLLIVCSFDSVGTQMLDQKLEEYLQTDQEEIILYLKRTPITHLKVYELILFHLYEKAQNYPTKFNVIFDIFNTKFKNHYQFVINLDTEINIQTKLNQPHQNIQFSQEGPLANQFKRGANGGTFDHLHIGHKVLLSLSLLAVNEHLTIGITGDILLQKKKLKGFLQSYETRCKCVKEFCSLFRPDIELNFSELVDPAGPTKNGQFEVLIATQETQKSLEYINNLRKEGGLNELEGYIIGIIENSNNQGDVKLSSSQIREQIQEKNRLSEQEYLELKSEWLSVSDNLYWFESILVDYYSQPQRHYSWKYTIKNTMNYITLQDTYMICQNNQMEPKIQRMQNWQPSFTMLYTILETMIMKKKVFCCFNNTPKNAIWIHNLYQLLSCKQKAIKLMCHSYQRMIYKI